MYNTLIESIERIFVSPSWTALDLIAIYPDNYQGSISDQNEFCRLNILPSSSEILAFGGIGDNKSLTGNVIITIFVKAGEGQRRVAEIADSLDDFLQYKAPAAGLGLGSSFIDIGGLDPKNAALYSASYTIPFTYYKE
jgi:hypothetical protein